MALKVTIWPEKPRGIEEKCMKKYMGKDSLLHLPLLQLGL